MPAMPASGQPCPWTPLLALVRHDPALWGAAIEHACAAAHVEVAELHSLPADQAQQLADSARVFLENRVSSAAASA